MRRAGADPFARRAAEAAHIAHGGGGDALAVCSVERPDLARRPRLAGTPPGSERTILAAPGAPLLDARGAAGVLEASGPDRLAVLARAARALFARATPAREAPSLARPRLVGGFAFGEGEGDASRGPAPSWRGFGAARLVFPERLFIYHEGRAWLTVAVRVARGEDPGAVAARLRALAAGGGEVAPARPGRPLGLSAAAGPPGGDDAEWSARVARALEEITAGRLEKVVLARALERRLERTPGPAALVEALRAAEPSTAVFAIAPEGANAVLAGATPERLASLAGGRAETVALAGSAPRGRSPEEAEAAARALLASPKEAREHALVVEGIAGALAPLAASISIGARRVRRLSRVLHLETPLAARLARPAHLLEVAALLHPTPAVAGTPRAAALRHLAREGGPARGWYAGALGWVDAAGDGELWVAIRSALVGRGRALLFAGAGIVAGSDAASERRETDAKLEALAAALERAAAPRRRSRAALAGAIP